MKRTWLAGALTICWLLGLGVGYATPAGAADEVSDKAADESEVAENGEEAAAEAPEEAPEEPSDSAPDYAGVRLTEVAVEGRNAELTLRQMRKELDGSGAAERIRPLYESELDSNTALVAVLEADQIAALDRRRLSDLRNLLSESLALMLGWQGELAAGAGVFEARFEQARVMEERWRATIEMLDNSMIPQEIKDRAASILEGVKKVESRLQQRLVILLSLQDDIAGAELFISEALDMVATSEGEFRGNLLVRDSPPLLRAIRESQVDLGASVRGELARRAQGIRDYALRNATLWVMQGILFVVLLGLMFVLRVRSAAWEADGYEAPLETTLYMVARPFSAAFVLTLVASIWIHPNMPTGVGQALMVVALVPLGRLLAGLASSRVRPALAALAVVFLVHVVSEMMPEASPSQRLILLFEMTLSAVFLAWLWRKRREKYRQSSGWLGAMLYIVPTALVMTAGSAVMNLVGRSHLAAVLADGVVIGAALAVLIWICTLITAAVARLTLRRRNRHILNIVRNHSLGLERFAIGAINFTAAFVWSRSFLGQLELYNPLMSWLRETIDHQWVVGKMTISVRTVLTFVVILLVAIGIARLIRVVLDEEIFARLSLPRGFPGLISLLLRYPVLLLGFVLAVSAAGIDLTSFGLMAGALGVGIGFGMQNIIANFVSGIILTFERPIQVGDTIAVGTLLGNVTSIGVRSSKVKTFDGSEVIVPNSDLISKEVINWTLSDRRRKMKLLLKVAYGSDPHQVMEILRRVASEHPDSLEDPPAKVLFNGHGENGLDFTLMYWVMFEKGISSRSDVALGVYDGLAEAGIRAPIPRTQVQVAEGATDDEKSAAVAGAARGSSATGTTAVGGGVSPGTAPSGSSG